MAKFFVTSLTTVLLVPSGIAGNLGQSSSMLIISIWLFQRYVKVLKIWLDCVSSIICFWFYMFFTHTIVSLRVQHFVYINERVNCYFLQAVDFLDKLLRYDHQDRLTAKEAMVCI